MRKRLLSMMVAIATTFSLVSCGGASSETGTESSNAGGKEVIDVWCWDPNFNIPIMNEAKRIYESQNPNVEIVINEMSTADVEQKIQMILSSGSTKELPEIICNRDINVQKYLKSFPGAFKDLTDIIPYDEFAKSKVKVLTGEDGRKYGVPYDSGVAAWYYRADILEEAGFGASDLENITWDEFIEIGKVVLEKTGKSLIAGNPSEPPVAMMMHSAGKWFFDAEGNVDIENNKPLKEALRISKELVETGVQSSEFGGEDMIKKLNSGEIAGTVSGIWYVPTIMQGKDQSGLWRVAPFPRLNVEGGVNASNSGGSAWMVLEKAEASETAADFLKTVYTNKEFYQTILKDVGAVCTHLPSNQGEEYSKGIEFFGGEPIYEINSKYMEEIPEINYGLYTGEAGQVVSTNFNDILNGSKSIDEATKAMHEQLEAQIGTN